MFAVILSLCLSKLVSTTIWKLPRQSGMSQFLSTFLPLCAVKRSILLPCSSFTEKAESISIIPLSRTCVNSFPDAADLFNLKKSVVTLWWQRLLLLPMSYATHTQHGALKQEWTLKRFNISWDTQTLLSRWKSTRITAHSPDKKQRSATQEPSCSGKLYHPCTTFVPHFCGIVEIYWSSLIWKGMSLFPIFYK